MAWKWIFVASVIISLVLAGFVGASWAWAPWWRVEVEQEPSNFVVKISRWKVAWILGQLGVWERGVWVTDKEKNLSQYSVPQKVVVAINEETYGGYQARDLESQRVLYGADETMQAGEILTFKIGLPNVNFYGEASKMTTIFRRQFLETLYGRSRQGTVMPLAQYQQEYQDRLDIWPQVMKNMGKIYAD